MQYWRLRVNPFKGADYNVYYKTLIDLLPTNVSRYAVIDGDLLDSFMPCVDQVELISKEVYFEHMND